MLINGKYLWISEGLLNHNSVSSYNEPSTGSSLTDGIELDSDTLAFCISASNQGNIHDFLDCKMDRSYPKCKRYIAMYWNSQLPSTTCKLSLMFFLLPLVMPACRRQVIPCIEWGLHQPSCCKFTHNLSFFRCRRFPIPPYLIPLLYLRRKYISSLGFPFRL